MMWWRRMAATTDRVGEAYNIGRGEQTSIWTLADQIHQITESDSEILHMDLQPGDVDASVADIFEKPEKNSDLNRVFRWQGAIECLRDTYRPEAYLWGVGRYQRISIKMCTQRV